MSVGGSIQEISLGGRNFAVAADADSQRKLGGFENESSPNGNGTARVIKTRVSWMLSDLTVDTDDQNGDAEFLQDLADDNDEFEVTITYASGVIYQGNGTISGEVNYSSTNATTALSLSGSGKLTPQ